MERLLIFICDNSVISQTDILSKFAEDYFNTSNYQIIKKSRGLKDLLFYRDINDFDSLVKDLVMPANLLLVDRIIIVSQTGCDCLVCRGKFCPIGKLDDSVNIARLKLAKKIINLRVFTPVNIFIIDKKSCEIKEILDNSYPSSELKNISTESS